MAPEHKLPHFDNPETGHERYDNLLGSEENQRTVVRAMFGEQTFEGRRENLGQANKLSRTYATLLEALNHHRGKAQQKVRVEHVHVHSGGQAVVGVVQPPGGGIA